VLRQLHQQLYSGRGHFATITKKCKLIVDYTPADARVRDVDGMLSALCHVLAKAGIVKDDGLIREVDWHEFPMDRENPMAVVTIR
jgi:Holliday junction resolvase RusA-like endonuclease